MMNAPRELIAGGPVDRRPGRPVLRLPRWLAVAAAGLLCLTGCSLLEDETFRLEKELAAARDFMSSLNYNAAADVYRPILEDLPEADPHWPEAAFGYATSLWHRTPPGDGLVDEARQVFESIIAARPGSDWARAARLNIARIHMLRDFPGDAEDPAAAIPILEAIAAEAEGFIRHEAMVRLVECHRMDFENRESLERARQLLTDWLAEHPANPLAALMWEQLGWMELLDFERPEAALAAFMEAEAIGFSDPSQGGLMLWRIAELARSAGRIGEAVRFYQKVVREAPSSGRAFEAQRALREIRASVPGMEAIQIPELKLFER